MCVGCGVRKGRGGRRGRAKVKVSFSSVTLEGLDVLGRKNMLSSKFNRIWCSILCQNENFREPVQRKVCELLNLFVFDFIENNNEDNSSFA